MSGSPKKKVSTPKPGKKPKIRPRINGKVKKSNTPKIQATVDQLQATVLHQRQEIANLSKENTKLKTQLKQKNRKLSVPVGKMPIKNNKIQAIDTGPGLGSAAASLAQKMGAKLKTNRLASSGIVSNVNRKDAASALMASMKKKKPESNGDEKSATNRIFSKYNKMIKMNMGLFSAINRMRQDGIDKKLITEFEKLHTAETTVDSADPSKYNLTIKDMVNVGKGIKMKRLHWDPIPLKYVEHSIWSQLKESSITYDSKHFELCFQVRQRKPIISKPGQNGRRNMNGVRNGKNTGPVEKVKFVSKKRSQQVQIGLKGLCLTNDQLRDVLHNMDEKILSVGQLGKLMNIAPNMDEQTEAEKRIMQDGTGHASDYGVAEAFFYNLCDFYHLEQRLKLWMFKQDFKEICDSLLQQYKAIGKACDRVRNNKNFRNLLTIVLTFGNHMNSGTQKGQCYGYNLKILTNLSSVKSFDNTRSLLMYIYEFCDRKYPKTLKVLPELQAAVKTASNMEIDTLQKAYARIQENVKQIKYLIESDEVENYDIDDKFISEMSKFYRATESKLKKFNMTVGNVTVSTKRLMKKFAFGSEDEPESIEKLFQILHLFLSDFQKSKEKLIKLEKERQKRILKRKKLREKSKKLKTKPKTKLPLKKAAAKPFININTSLKPMKKPSKPSPSRFHSGRFTPTPIMATMSEDAESKDDFFPDDEEIIDANPFLSQNSSLRAELKKQVEFEKRKMSIHQNLRGHIRERSRFVSTGGQLTPQVEKQNATMRRLSSMYQQTQNEISLIEEARKKAAILKYNRFRLPPLKKHNTSAFYANMKSGSPQKGKNARARANTPAFINMDSELPDGAMVKAPPRQIRPNGRTSTSPKTVKTIKSATPGITKKVKPKLIEAKAKAMSYTKPMIAWSPNDVKPTKIVTNGSAHSTPKSDGKNVKRQWGKTGAKHRKKSSKIRHRSPPAKKATDDFPPPPPLTNQQQQQYIQQQQNMQQMQNVQRNMAQQQRPVSMPPNSNAVFNNMAYNPQMAYHHQQQQLGYGSTPNFNYQQQQQMQYQQQMMAQNQYMPQNQQQQQQRGYNQQTAYR